MKIEWTDAALKDLDSIYNYISADSNVNAKSFVEKIIISVEKLIDFPEIGKIVPEANDVNIRELLFQCFRVIYRIKNEMIQILTIIRASRDLSTMSPKPWEII